MLVPIPEVVHPVPPVQVIENDLLRLRVRREPRDAAGSARAGGDVVGNDRLASDPPAEKHAANLGAEVLEAGAVNLVLYGARADEEWAVHHGSPVLSQ